MNTTKRNRPSPEGQKQLETLRQAVDKTLEKKRRLGQYAVTWKDGKPVIAGEDAPEPSSAPST
jgi:DNA-binding PadR family transcriptional regulator